VRFFVDLQCLFQNDCPMSWLGKRGSHWCGLALCWIAASTVGGEKGELFPPLRFDRTSLMGLFGFYGELSGATAIFFGYPGYDWHSQNLTFTTEKPLSRSDLMLRCEQAIESQAGLTVVHIQTPAAPVALDLVKQKYCLILEKLTNQFPELKVYLDQTRPRRPQF
jgi:hypothetical protein